MDKDDDMEWKYDKGDEAMFTCTDSSWARVGSVRCKVTRRATDLDADLDETGPMYRVELDEPIDIDGFVIGRYSAYEDELTPID